MIKLKQTTISYPSKHPLLKNISLELNPKETIVISGPTGSGKTTLLKTIRGEILPTTGDILYDGKSITKLSTLSKRMLKQIIGISEQIPILLEDRSIKDNVSLPLRLRGIKGSILSKRVQEVLALFNLEEIQHQAVNELSSGERKLVSIARALAQKPKYLLLDEPLAGLDPRTGEELIKRLEALKKGERFSLVIATHNPMMISKLKIDKAYKIYNNTLVAMKDPRFLFLFDGRLL